MVYFNTVSLFTLQLAYNLCNLYIFQNAEKISTELQLLSQPCVNDHSLVKPSLLRRNSSISCTNCSFSGFSIYHYSHTAFIRRFFCKQMKMLIFVFSVCVEFALKKHNWSLFKNCIKSWLQTDLFNLNYQHMIKTSNSFHFVQLTSYKRKTKEGWQKASASIRSVPYSILRFAPFFSNTSILLLDGTHKNVYDRKRRIFQNPDN